MAGNPLALLLILMPIAVVVLYEVTCHVHAYKVCKDTIRKDPEPPCKVKRSFKYGQEDILIANAFARYYEPCMRCRSPEDPLLYRTNSLMYYLVCPQCNAHTDMYGSIAIARRMWGWGDLIEPSEYDLRSEYVQNTSEQEDTDKPVNKPLIRRLLE